MVHKILRQKVIRCPNAELAQTKAHVLGEGAGVSHRSQVHTSRGPDHGDALFQVFPPILLPISMNSFANSRNTSLESSSDTPLPCGACWRPSSLARLRRNW